MNSYHNREAHKISFAQEAETCPRVSVAFTVLTATIEVGAEELPAPVLRGILQAVSDAQLAACDANARLRGRWVDDIELRLATEERATELEGEADDLRDEISDLKKEVERLEQENDRLQSRVDDLAEQLQEVGV